MTARTENLVERFLRETLNLQKNTKPQKVLKARVYKIGKANVLIRAASGGNRGYFYGINYITIEEMANLSNPYIAFICGSIDKVVIIPAQLLFDNLDKISYDRNGEYKINIDWNLNMVLKGRGNRLDCKQYVNNKEALMSPAQQTTREVKAVEDSMHSILQGRLLEVGNYRGYQTYCPDKSKQFNGKSLEDIASLKKCPDLQFANYELLRKIDVLWFRQERENLIPDKAFEIELSTGTWSGVGRMATLVDYSHVNCYVISNNIKTYNKVVNTFPVYKNRFLHIKPDLVGDLYSAEKNIMQLRRRIGL